MSSRKTPTPPQDKAIILRVDVENRQEQIAETIATVIDLVPVIGGVVSSIISGQVTQNRFERVADEIKKITAEVRANADSVQDEYVRSEEFEELFAQTLEKMSKELNPEKRAVYRHFIVNLMVLPGENYDRQRRLLRLTEELEPKHLRLLRAYAEPPDPAVSPSGLGTPVGTLGRRTGWRADVIAHFAAELISEGLLGEGANLMTTMTAAGAEDQRGRITDLGRRWLQFTAE